MPWPELRRVLLVVVVLFILGLMLWAVGPTGMDVLDGPEWQQP